MLRLLDWEDIWKEISWQDFFNFFTGFIFTLAFYIL